MKKITLTLVATVVILFFFTGCDKYHRDRYTGTWEFVTEKNFYIGRYDTGLVEIKRDTIYHLGIISLGNYENNIIIQYTENDTINAYLDQNGFIYNKDLEYGGKYPFGEFKNKQQQLSFRLNLIEDINPRFYSISGTKKGRR